MTPSFGNNRLSVINISNMAAVQTCEVEAIVAALNIGSKFVNCFFRKVKNNITAV
jgi:hypothetical protein